MVAERDPGLVRAIRKAGHEVASHGYGHRPIRGDGRKEFIEDTDRSKKLIEDLTGEPVKGYRATTFSIVRETLWALDVLAEMGFAYDSSIFPIRHDRAGISTPRARTAILGLIEVPLTRRARPERSDLG
jgi:peptidoglycan/xylan/chitin deacetylase (PgdA/CDA1 family)